MAKRPPAGTSAYKAYLRNSSNGPSSSPPSKGSFVDRLQNVMNGAGNIIPPSVDGNIHPEVSTTHPANVYGSSKPLVSKPRRPSGGPTDIYTSASDAGHSGAISAPSLDYLNADLAKYYRMDRTTAYNEALANTAYQRAVKDMQDAGLNPAVLFGNGRVSPADGVYGATPIDATSVGYYSYGSSGSSGGSGSGRRHGSSSRSSGKLFSSSTYAMISGLGALAGAGIAAATGGSAGLGALTGSNLATSAAKVLNGLFKK